MDNSRCQIISEMFLGHGRRSRQEGRRSNPKFLSCGTLKSSSTWGILGVKGVLGGLYLEKGDGFGGGNDDLWAVCHKVFTGELL